MRRICQLVCISGIFLLTVGTPAIEAAAVATSSQPVPPPPFPDSFTGELINMTDFAPPNDDAWRLQRPNRQIKLDVSAVRARARRLWNSRVTIQGHWSGPVGTPGRVFRVISIRRA